MKIYMHRYTNPEGNECLYAHSSKRKRATAVAAARRDDEYIHADHDLYEVDVEPTKKGMIEWFNRR